jgi:hypothetical protein
MSYLKTVLSYHQPSEAEVDKAFLESHGLTVCLLNGNTARNELGAPFFIQLQVMEEEHDQAVAILREANPGRFGSPARVAELDRAIKRGVFTFLAGAVPAAIAVYFMMPAPVRSLRLDQFRPADSRPAATLAAAFLGGMLAVIVAKRKRPNQIS